MIIPLTQGYEARVSPEDYDVLTRWRWQAQVNHDGSVYAKRTEKRTNVLGVYTAKVFMHRFITSCKPGLHVDHINRDTLDNRRSNLRVVPPGHNMQNRVIERGRCGFIGVIIVGKRFRARLKADGKWYSLGYHGTAEDAARAYDAKALEIFGPFAQVNFPQHQESEPDDIPF